MQKIPLKEFRSGALFRFGFVANVGIWLPISLVFSLLALFGANTVRWNGIPVHGIRGAALGLLLGLIFSVVGTFLFVLGAKIASLLSDHLPPIPIGTSEEEDAE